MYMILLDLPSGSHEDMNNMSDNWSWPIRDDSFGNMMWLFGRLDRTIGISEIVLKDGLINIHSHTRILETLTPYQATTWSDPDFGLWLQIDKTLANTQPWPSPNASAHFTYPIGFIECLEKLVVILLWWHTCLPEDGRRTVQLVRGFLKTAMSRRKNHTNHHRQGVNFLVEDHVYLQATSL